MPEASEPVLVYTRIAANERNTRWLVGTFAAVLLPVVTAATSWLMPIVTVIFLMIASRVVGADRLFNGVLAMDAELTAKAQAGATQLRDLPSSFLWFAGGMIALALAAVTIVTAIVVAFLVGRYGSRMLLRAAHARIILPDEDRDVVRLVENLCIGAGLPMPTLYIIPSPSPNAFATGKDPQNASLVFTRGLLTLLHRRELQGVIAHELSHIGNRDTRLMTLLAAIVTTAALPWKIGFAALRRAIEVNPIIGVFMSLFALCFGWLTFSAWAYSIAYLMSDDAATELPSFMWWWVAHAALAPIYALVVAPIAALVIRQAVSREREFLADADAVTLTRDPEGLAVALAKIASAGGQKMRVGEGVVHLYIADPRGGRSFLHQIFPSHPPMEERIQLLARMGQGIPAAVLDEAIEAGKQFQATAAVMPIDAGVADASTQAGDFHAERPAAIDPPDEFLAENPDPPRPRARTFPVYEQPDGWSKVLAELDQNAAVTPLGKVGEFVRVVTAENIRGYVSATAGLNALRRGAAGPDGQLSVEK
jgi:heat shock protein HtpX